MQESPIFAKTYDLLRWLIPLTIKFPRHQRFVLANELQQVTFKLQNCLFEAVRLPQPAQALAAADIELDKLRLYLRLSHELGLGVTHLTFNHVISRRNDEKSLRFN